MGTQKKLLLLLSVVLFLNILEIDAQNFATIDADSASALIQYHELDPNFIILDVRTMSEYNSKHIENGVELNYYLSEFDAILDTLIKDKIYLIHCASGGRSGNVFTSMQNKGFTDVFNLSGGLSAWENAGKPVTTNVSPIMLSVSDTIANFTATELLATSSVELKLTNYGNDTLRFNSITDISNTEFSTNFNVNAEVTGLMDYSFTVYYSPEDLINDSIVFEIESTGGILKYVFTGNAVETFISERNRNVLKVYPNPTKGVFTIEADNIGFVSLSDIQGKTVYQIENPNSLSTIDISNRELGLYILRIQSDNKIITKKIILE
jgi:rhodanese-related sulfurtransferase